MRGFLQSIDLREVEGEYSPMLEASRVIREIDAPCLLKVRGWDGGVWKVASNIFSSRELLCSALGCTKENLIKRLMGGGDGSVKVVKDSPTLEFEKDANLRELPILQHFREDGGPYITGGVLFSEYGGVQNASVHRIQMLDAKRGVVRLVAPRHTYLLHSKAVENGDELPVALAIGVEPVVLLSACTRVELGMELMYASSLKGEPIEVFECSNGVKVPHAEFVLEGYISSEREREGPFVDITGTYDRVRHEPVIYFERMYHRSDPIYHAIMPSSPEHKVLMGIPYEPIIYRAVSEVADVVNVVMSVGGCCYLHAIVQIRKKTEGDGKNAALAALGAHGSLKHVVVVDEDIDVFDINDVEYAIATRVQADRDVFIVKGARGSSLDPSSVDGTSTKVGIDATKKNNLDAYKRVKE
ncbi:UbiD family decarboxylase [Methanosarcinales archaeon]|nr:MAG: UbiD family decarboxylase [Methanosarcinales archaeon]